MDHQAHPDFDNDWCRELLSAPNIQRSDFIPKHESASNSMFKELLYVPRGIKAHVVFRRPSSEPDAITGNEECSLFSLGNGVDGKSGRAHGGFNALILDQITGSCAFHAVKPGASPPATATLTVDYKAPINTPCVILARAWTTEISGRKIWAKAVIEDCNGKVLAAGKALYIAAREGSL